MPRARLTKSQLDFFPSIIVVAPRRYKYAGSAYATHSQCVYLLLSARTNCKKALVLLTASTHTATCALTADLIYFAACEDASLCTAAPAARTGRSPGRKAPKQAPVNAQVPRGPHSTLHVRAAIVFLNNNSASPAVQSPVQCQQGPPPAVNANASLAHPSLPSLGHAGTLSKRGHTLAGHRGAPGEAATPRSGARCEDAAERLSSASPPEAGGVPAAVGAAEAQAPSSSSDNVKVPLRNCPD